MHLKRHAAAALERFLVALDRALTQRVVIVVIGGSALALGYGVASVTSDIDTLGDPLEPRWSLFHLVTEIWGEIAALDLRP